jgi:hypothetical protein
MLQASIPPSSTEHVENRDPQKKRRCIQAPHAMMANKDAFLVFRPFGDNFLHQFLSKNVAPSM